MLNRLTFLIVFPCLVACTTPLLATPLTYSIAGTVTNSAFKPYGLSLADSTVSGHFSYDPTAPATRTLTNGLGYDQHIDDGFQVVIGGVTVTASDYVVEILNNVLQLDHVTVKDEFLVTFSSGLTPALDSPLVVNGAPRSAGLVTLQFLADANLFPDASLPTSFNFASFTSATGLFGAQPVGGVDLFTVTPEPSSLALLGLGLSLLCIHRVRRGLVIKA